MDNINVTIKVSDLSKLVLKSDLYDTNERYYIDKIKKLESEIEQLKKQLEQKENEQ